MKRSLLFAAVVFLISAWSTPARAQFGMAGSLANKDPNAQIKTDASTIKGRLSQYSHAPTHHSRITLPKVSNSASLDAYGRMDLSGRSVSGYPAVRDMNSNHASSRSSLHGVARRRPPARRR